MKRNILPITFPIVFAVAFLVSTATTAQAVDPACSLARAAGQYGFSDSGTMNLSGTYSVNPDCTGAASFDEFDQSGKILTATVEIVWDNNMREARFVFTSVTLADGMALSPVINGDARKLVP